MEHLTFIRHEYAFVHCSCRFTDDFILKRHPSGFIGNYFLFHDPNRNKNVPNFSPFRKMKFHSRDWHASECRIPLLPICFAKWSTSNEMCWKYISGWNRVNRSMMLGCIRCFIFGSIAWRTRSFRLICGRIYAVGAIIRLNHLCWTGRSGGFFSTPTCIIRAHTCMCTWKLTIYRCHIFQLNNCCQQGDFASITI